MNTPQNASVWRRFVCMGYESFLLVGPVLVLGFVYAVIFDQNDRHPEGTDLKTLGLQLLIYFAILAYFAWGWSRGRVTLPMQTLGLEVVDAESGGPISRGRAFLRAVIGSLSVLSGLWLITALMRPDRQALHDWAVKTRLVYLPVAIRRSQREGA